MNTQIRKGTSNNKQRNEKTKEQHEKTKATR